MSIAKTYRFVTCDLCGANDYRIYGISPTPDKHIHFQVVQCKRCGLIYALPQATQETLKRFYEEDYPEKVAPSWEANLSQEKLEKLKAFIKMLGEPGRLCDVGCGYGILLKVAKELGWEVWGVEPSNALASYAKKILGSEAKVLIGTIYEVELPKDYFDVVIMWHVLEHVDSPTHYLQKIRAILKESGRLIIGVPNGADLIHRLARIVKWKNRMRNADFGEHTYTFSPRTLKMFLEKVGFKVETLKVYYSTSDTTMHHYRHPLAKMIARYLRFLPNVGPLIQVVARK